MDSRGIPLVHELSDAEIRWLAYTVQQEDFQTGVDLPLSEKPGLWIVDWGQVELTVSTAVNSQGCRITAGNFFATEDVCLGDPCVAKMAKTCVETRMLYLPSEQAATMLSAFPEMLKVCSRPPDIVAELARVPLLASDSCMTLDHVRHLAQHCAWVFVPEGHNITAQGTPGYSLVILRSGAAVVSRIDERGRLRPRSYLSPGIIYGTTSLLEGRPHDCTVRSVVSPQKIGQPKWNGAEILMLDRRDLRYAFAERPDLWHPGIALFDGWRELSEETRKFPWLDNGELVIWVSRAHISRLVAYELAILLVFLGSLLASFGLLPVYSPVPRIIILCALVGLVYLPMALWVLIRYLRNYYAATNRRVIRGYHHLGLRQRYAEMPIEEV